MWVLSVTAPGAPARRHIFVAAEIRIGSDPTSDLVIAGADARHARYVIKDAKYIVVDLKSNTGTHVNGRRIVSPVVVRVGDRVDIAEHRLDIIDVSATAADLRGALYGEDEEALIDAIEDGDDHSRAVYADLLESRGDLARAELVRVMDMGTRTLYVLGLMIGTHPGWRMRLARVPIENCAEPTCPGRWHALRTVVLDQFRTCATCRRDVHYCASVADAKGRGPVAIDPLAIRWGNDLLR